MEIREFAEQVLFGRTLAEKLADPGDVTDLRPGPAMVAPEMPGRPAELLFKRVIGGAKDPAGLFPGTRHLDRGDERGRVLHFFANHELLAVELMALALLRFPEAPPAFRRGLLKTLRDEQEHTRWYMERMRACGVQFGELPVSGHLWRLLAGMETPLDYVSGLPLTFEQANLDFSREYGRAFAAAGDAETAALLERIHRDEIGHVAYGLKWFRRWKDPALDDWQAYERQLQFPLSPSRAKGGVVQVEGRIAAGLDDRFIAELTVYGRSRGRAPTVHWFNPLAEAGIAFGPGYQPSEIQQTLVEDLSILPLYRAVRDDVVLVSRKPSTPFLTGLVQAGFVVPEFEELVGGRIDERGVLTERALGGLNPWAWSPDSIALLGPLAEKVAVSRCPELRPFDAARAALYGKPWSADFLRRWLATVEPQGWLCDASVVGTTVTTPAEAWAAIEALRSRGQHRVGVKAELGLAGNNAVRLWETEVLPTQRRWIEGQLSAGRRLVVEPWLERLADFSVQFEMAREGLRVVGYTGLQNDLRGQFQSNWAEARFGRRPPSAVLRALGSGAVVKLPRDIGGRLHGLYLELATMLEPELRAIGHEGPLGIDAFVYRDASGVARLKPMVEINPRHTMGRILLELMRAIAPGRTGRFRLRSLKEVRAEGYADFPAYARHVAEASPWKREGEPVPRLVSGTVCLSDPATAKGWMAVLEIG